MFLVAILLDRAQYPWMKYCATAMRQMLTLWDASLIVMHGRTMFNVVMMMTSCCFYDYICVCATIWASSMPTHICQFLGLCLPCAQHAWSFFLGFLFSCISAIILEGVVYFLARLQLLHVDLIAGSLLFATVCTISNIDCLFFIHHKYNIYCLSKI